MMLDDDLESRILSFERGWRQGGPSKIGDYLYCRSQANPERRRRLLVELICVDLEFRWRNYVPGQLGSEPALLDGYVGLFPELGALDQLPLELIGQEYRVRRQLGDRPTHDDVIARFRMRQESIRAELRLIDCEIENESGNPGTIAPSPKRSSANEPRAGRMVSGRLLSHRDLLLRKMIGSGLMGKVYEAWQHSARRAVAVKFLRKSFLLEPRVVQRFIDEASTIARLAHPNIVKAYGLGRTPGNAYFIVIELVSGPNLAVAGSRTVVSIEDAVHWTIETCSALEHAHDRGIIHCDLKPANLLLDTDGSVRVADFGFARTLSDRTPWNGDLEGTAPFMAPEQASRCWGDVGIRTDVYGLGAVLYALLAGRPPWLGRRLPDILAQVTSAAPVVPLKSLRPDVPEPLDDICRKCLSKSPGDRYSTLREVRASLARLIG